MKDWNCFLLDFDFTIADSSEGIVKCFNRSFEALGLPTCSKRAIKQTIGMSLSAAFRRLQRDQNRDLSERFAHLFREASKQVMTENAAVYSGVEEFLRWARQQDIKVGIVTSKDAFTVRKILKKYDCDEYVDVVIGEEDVVRTKPDAEPINAAIGHLGVPKSSAVYIGDCLVDAETAWGAQVDFVAVLTGCTSEDDFMTCGFPVRGIFRSVDEFWDTLQRGCYQS